MSFLFADRASSPPSSAPARQPAAKDRVGLAIAAIATVMGLWLGLVAPATSPVTPVVPLAPVTTVQGGTPAAGAP